MRQRRSDEDFKKEIESHIAIETDRLIAEGASPVEAHDAAIRKFGNVTIAGERFYQSRRMLWLDQLRQDVRYAFRSFARTPGFTVVAVLTLALGIGANTAIFSVVNAVLLRPLPYKGSDRLVRLLEPPTPAVTAGAPRPPSGINALEIAALRSGARTLTHIGVSQSLTATVTVKQSAVRLEGTRVSPALFDMLNAPLAAGRGFAAGEEVAGADAVMVLSHATWHRLFGGDPAAVGSSLLVDGRPHVVVGITGTGFSYPDPATQFWTPLVIPTGRLATIQRMAPIARLADGVSPDAARDEVIAILGNIRRSGFSAPPPPPMPAGAGPAPPSWSALAPPEQPQIDVIGLHDQIVEPVRPALLLLMAAVGLVLLIACVNVANLLLARTAARQREIAVRRALGAGPSRLIRQVMTESVMLSIAGGVVGLLLGLGGVQLLQILGTSLPRRDLAQGTGLPRVNELGLDGSTFAFAALAAIVTGLVFGLAPALRHVRGGDAANLRDNPGAAISGFNLLRGQRMQGLLVVAEIAMATTLFVGGALLIRSFVNLGSLDPGYDAANVLTFQISLPGRTTGTPLEVAEDIVARLRAMPGVGAAGYAESLPTINRRSGLFLRRTSEMPRVPPAPPAPGATVPPETPDTRLVSREYLAVMGISIVEGRSFGDPAGPPHALINQALARSGFLGEHPIGAHVYAIGQKPWEIVGIVEDVRQFGLEQDAPPQVFFDLQQIRRLPSAPNAAPPPGRVEYFAVRTIGEPTALIASIRGIASQIDPQATIENVATMEQIVANSMLRPRLYAVLLGVFAVVAVMLAAIGIYRVMAYSVSQRVREIGIRIAMGAERASVMGLVLRQSAILTVLGMSIGLAGAAALTRYLERMLFGLTPLDPGTFIGVALVFGAVASLAAVMPARRATRVDPLVALRCE